MNLDQMAARFAEARKGDGAWVVWYYAEGVSVHSLHDEEIEAHRVCQHDCADFGRVSFVPFGVKVSEYIEERQTVLVSNMTHAPAIRHDPTLPPGEVRFEDEHGHYVGRIIGLDHG